MDDRVATLTREISTHAQSKQLDEALAAFAKFDREGLRPNRYTYAALINAHINSGDVDGGVRVLQQMEAQGYVPNLVIMTTLLKGHCAVGDLAAARQLLESMGTLKPQPVRPDARTLNTFMRGCVRAGDLEAAQWAYAQLAEWKLTPAAASTVAFGRLLSQGLKLGSLRRALKQHTEHAGVQLAHRPSRTANPCLFWERGRCDRGDNCNFYHDPSIRQSDAHQVEAARRDTELELSVQLAHAAALLGRRKACKHALARAAALQAAADAVEGGGHSSGSANWGGGGGSWGGGDEQREENRYGTGLHAAFRRTELARDAERIAASLDVSGEGEKARGGGSGARSDRRLDLYLSRCLVFSSRLLPPDGHAQSQRLSGTEVAAALLSALCRTAGLKQASKLGLASLKRVRKHIERCVSRKGKLRWRRVFRSPLPQSSPDSSSEAAAAAARLPVKIEIASGTGDWVVAQARADAGRANWACVELRHDRVYSTFSRMALQAVPNLCVMGGDAAAVVRDRLRPRSVAHAFINFPEPPSGYLGYEASNSLHLLTREFFVDLHRVLEPGGHLTIFSDNGRYCRALAKTLGALRADGAASGPLLLTSVDVARDPSASTHDEAIGSVKLYAGVPGAECGHLQHETSYFDRLWEYRQGEETERWFMHLQRPP